jgi:uncharacterized protein involved in type VI secretion and phage assembly
MPQYFGKYRGTVINNVDPEFRGRLLLMVPDVYQLIPSTWAEPCVPLAGPTGPPMGVYMVPPIGTGVWVEFEQGNPDYPVWVGCRWGAASDVPPLALAGLPVSPNIVVQTAGQNAIIISDVPAIGILLKTAGGASVMVNDTGIYIQNTGPTLNITGATINITGTAINLMGTVNINSGALIVT